MTFLLALGGVLAGMAGAAMLYLASPHQKLRAAALPKWPALIGGAAALVISLFLFELIMGPATAVFAWLTWLMLLWSAPPLAFAWWRGRGEHRR